MTKRLPTPTRVALALFTILLTANAQTEQAADGPIAPGVEISTASLAPEFPDLDKTLDIAKAGYTEAPRQIPATVIDNGVLAYVPYSSYQIGPDRELNIYGDPKNPACVEIGLYRTLLNNPEEMHRCLALLHRIVPNIDLMHLRPSGGRMLKNGVVAEITPPDAPDAYGGWWISIYNLDKLHAEQGTEASVSIITVPKDVILRQTAGKVTDWNPEDIHKSRRTAGPKTDDTSGSVYVRDYYKKDGTYVPGHYRSRR